MKRIICTESQAPAKFCLTQAQTELLARHAIAALRARPTLVRVRSPCVVLGDIHGQFEDLLAIMRFFGSPPKGRFVFLGDYVDRGPKGLECLGLLLCLQVLFPADVHLLRGNHEAASINEAFGFKEECLTRASRDVFEALTAVYDFLPVAAVVDEYILCLHGGIGPGLESLRQIERLTRPLPEASQGIECDLMWADPHSASSQTEFAPNADRGISYLFPKVRVDAFLRRNRLRLMVRGHQLVQAGWQHSFDRRVLTVFSAPNYCGCGNHAAALQVEPGRRCHVVTFPPRRAPPTARPPRIMYARLPHKREALPIPEAGEDAPKGPKD